MMGFQLLTFKSFVYAVSVKICVKIVSLLGTTISLLQNVLWPMCWQTITRLRNLLLLGNLGRLSSFSGGLTNTQV